MITFSTVEKLAHFIQDYVMCVCVCVCVHVHVICQKEMDVQMKNCGLPFNLDDPLASRHCTLVARVEGTCKGGLIQSGSKKIKML